MKRALSISCLWICLLVLSSSVIMGQDNHLDITPTPQSLVQKNGHFTLNSKTSFAIGKNQRADLKKVAAYFQSKILYSTGYNLNIKNSGSTSAVSTDSPAFFIFSPEVHKDTFSESVRRILPIGDDRYHLFRERVLSLFFLSILF